MKMIPKGKCKRINLACGNNPVKGFTGIDLLKEGTKADYCFDLEQYPWPIESGVAEQVHCAHFIEHVDDAISFIDEIYRILKPGGAVRFVAPYYTSIRAWQDPTHKRAISEAFFHYFDQDWRKFANVDQYPIKSRFKVEKIDHSVNQAWAGKSQDALQFAATHYWNVIDDILVTMRKVK